MVQTPNPIEQFDQPSSIELGSEIVRKTYHAPHLKDYGHLREVTQTSNPPGGTIDDGGGAPIYTS